MHFPWSAPPFCIYKEISKNTKENLVQSLLCKTEVKYLVESFHLFGQHSWSPDELKDTHLEEIACKEICMCMQFLAKLHTHAIGHAIFHGMQFCQDGCPLTRLDFRNAVQRDESSQLNIWPPFCTIKIWLNFPLYFLKFPLYLQKAAALQEKCLYNPNFFFNDFVWSIHSYIFIAVDQMWKNVFLEHPTIEVTNMLYFRKP